MSSQAAVKKIMSIISALFLGAGSLGCSGKVFSGLLDKDMIPFFSLIVLNGAPRVSLTSTPAINLANVGSYSVSGTCSVEGQPVTVTISDGTATATATPVCTAKSFTANSWTPAVSGVSDSQTILITADHANIKGKAARQARATVVKDTVAPGVTISSTAPQPTNLAIPVTITFSESVTGFDVSDITVGNGTAGSFSGSGTTYTAVITPTAEGAVTVDVNAGVAQDAIGNPTTAAAQLTRTYDLTNLLVSISSTAPDPTNTSIPITITFSRSVTGFESTDITVGNGSVSGFSGGSGVAVYTATIIPTDQGAVTVDISAGVAQDVMSITNIAATQFTRTYDSIPPAVSIGAPSASLINSGGSTVYTLTYDVAPTGLVSGNIHVHGAGGVTCSTVNVADAATTTPDVTVSGCTGNGSFYISVDAGLSQDTAGNSDLGDSTSDSVTVDNTPPTITSVYTLKSDGTYTIGEHINIVVTFSEPVTLAGGSATLNVGLNSSATLHMPTFSGASTNLDYVVAAGESTPVSTKLDSSGISVGGGGTLTDAAGNAVSNFTPSTNISASRSIYIDAILPAITSAETMDIDSDGKIDHYKVTFNRNINDSTFVAGQWSVAGYTITGLDTSAAAPISDVGNDTILYIAFTELGGTTGDTGAKPDLTTPGAVSLTDFRGNPMTPIGVSDVVETDKAAPVIMRATGRTGVTGLSIEFSEQVDANGSAGGCPEAGDGYNLSTASFVYTDTSGDGAGSISGMGSDATACSSTGLYTVSTVLNAEMEATDLSAPDHVAPALNAIRDMGDNWADSGRQTAVTGAVSPYVLDVYPNLKTKIRVSFSEPVDNSAATNATSALNLANYTLVENPVESGCSAGGGGADTVAISTTPIVDVNGDGTVFELTTTASQCGSTTYQLTVNQAIIDQDDHVELVAPYIMTFLGNEQLRVVSGSTIDIQHMVVVFNKAVQAGTSTGGAENVNRYHFNNTTAGTAATSAVRGTGSNVNRVTLGTSFFQKARTYMVIGANGDNLYGFNESGVGAIMTTTNAAEGAESPQESLQAYPKDRAPWVGYGTPILNFDDGPISEDPFADTSTFGYLASYSGKVYIGPNNLGNATSRMDPDGSNPEVAYFQFLKDTTGSTSGGDGATQQSSNTATTRDGTIAVPPYVTIGHSGCTSNSANINTGCGPDNENGRGVFSTGMIGSTGYLLLGGARTTSSGGDYYFDYVYYTSQVGDILTFNYIDMEDITGTVTSGLSAITIFNDRLQVGMAKVNYVTEGNNAPDFGKVSFNSADGTHCTAGANCDASDGTRGNRYMINYMDYFGGRDQYGTENTHANRAYIVGVDALYSFNGRLYAANGGLNYMNRDGGVIRSDGTNYANPAICSTQDTCPNWVEVAPRTATEWYNTDQDASGIRFSLELVKLADMIPNDKATPAFAEYEGKLYMIRNTCAVRNANGNQQTSAHYITGCTQNTASTPYTYVASEFSNRQPQLWVCTPGTTGDANECDAGDWALVDTTTSPDGITNFGDSNNHSISMVMKSGKYLYVGLDNINGVQFYRVKTNAGVPIANPKEEDFERIGTGSPGIDGTEYKEIYSAITIPGTGIYSNYSFLYVSAGKNSTPVAIFIEMGGNTAAYE